MSIRKIVARSVAAVVCCSLQFLATPAHADWTPACTPDLIHVNDAVVSTRCQENGKWYHLFFAEWPNGHVDRVGRMLQAVQLSGKKVLFFDTGGLNGSATERRYSHIALPK